MSIWSVLGLAPVRDTAAIKKAYALKLRTTRPDDDAAAYQQLRESFDAAMAYAKAAPSAMQADTQWHDAWAQPVEEGIPAAAGEANWQDTPPAGAAAPAEPQWHAASAPPPVPAIDPHDLVNATRKLWKDHGEAMLIAYWPQLRSVLHELSLMQTFACSTAFAKMILEEPDLPLEMVDLLTLFFGWGSDYKRMPDLAGHDAVQFRRRLQLVEQQLAQRQRQKELKEEQDRVRADHMAEQLARRQRQQELKEEQDRIKAARQLKRQRQQELQEERDRLEAAARERERVRQQAMDARRRFGHLLPFARMLITAGPRTSTLYAMLMGPILGQQWSRLDQQQRALLGIEDPSFYGGLDICKEAMSLRGLLGLVLLPLAFGLHASPGSLSLFFMLPVLGLLACVWLPVYTWQESARARLWHKVFASQWLRGSRIGTWFSPQSWVVSSTLALLLCLAVAPSLTAAGWRYWPGQGMAAIVLLACQWLAPPDRQHETPELIVPVLIFCLAACQAMGVTDVLTQLSLSAFWLAISYPAIGSGWRRALWAARALALVAVASYWSGKASGGVALGLLVPWLVFIFARRQSSGFVIATLAIAWLSQPFDNPALLGLWTGALVIAGAYLFALMRKTAGRIAVRFQPD